MPVNYPAPPPPVAAPACPHCVAQIKLAPALACKNCGKRVRPARYGDPVDRRKHKWVHANGQANCNHLGE